MSLKDALLALRIINREARANILFWRRGTAGVIEMVPEIGAEGVDGVNELGQEEEAQAGADIFYTDGWLEFRNQMRLEVGYSWAMIFVFLCSRYKSQVPTFDIEHMSGNLRDLSKTQETGYHLQKGSKIFTYIKTSAMKHQPSQRLFCLKTIIS